MVAIQLKILIPDGIATRNVKNEKTVAATSDSDVNIWCPQTRNDMIAIAILEYAIAA